MKLLEIVGFNSQSFRQSKICKISFNSKRDVHNALYKSTWKFFCFSSMVFYEDQIRCLDITCRCAYKC